MTPFYIFISVFCGLLVLLFLAYTYILVNSSDERYEPELKEVGKVLVKIYGKKSSPDDTIPTWELEFTGDGFQSYMFDQQHFHIVSAYDRFLAWRKTGNSGSLDVGNNTFIPLCNIDRIEIEEEKFQKMIGKM